MQLLNRGHYRQKDFHHYLQNHIQVYMGQYFDHLGFNIIDEWHILGEFHGSEELSTQGRMGNIKGLPSEEDLVKIRKDSARIVTPS